MSVQVSHLVKTYGAQRAVDDVSFEAQKGQVLGFLGPNGAGKSTTMKVVTGFLPPSSGSVKVCGIDPETDPMAVRKKIGYLPEHNPLYLDMYVREYLEFVGKLHKVSKLGDRIEAMIEQVGLTREANKRIQALSKGYRQRVGLAQSMLHDPEVLILDEPTSGLDPNQLAGIREMIQELGKTKTVILSTHIMQEVQAVCDRVLIINQGKLVADDSIAGLQDRISGESVVVIELDRPIDMTFIEAIKGVQRIERQADTTYRVFADPSVDIRKGLFKLAVEKDRVLLGMSRETYSVEEVFRQLTAG